MIIGISGKMGTGKTTLANHLAELCGGRVVSFADALRDEVSEVFRVTHEEMTDRVRKETMKVAVGFRYVTLRELLQWWGGMRRETDADYWVDKLIRSVGRGELVFVDDVRYYNEACAIRAAGGKVFRLDVYPGWQSGAGADHLSETDLDEGFGFDWRFAPVFGSLQAHAEQLVGLVEKSAA